MEPKGGSVRTMTELMDKSGWTWLCILVHGTALLYHHGDSPLSSQSSKGCGSGSVYLLGPEGDPTTSDDVSGH
jgi:hypothetical protein